MKKYFTAILLLLMLLITGCSSTLNSTDEEANEQNKPNDNVISAFAEMPPVNEAGIKSSEEISKSSGLLTDVFDMEKYHYIGFDGKDSFIIRDYNDSVLRKVNINTGVIDDVMDISTNKGHYIMAELYADGWVIWSESFDKDLHVGISTGDDWAVYAANIDTKEIIEIDSEKASFPKNRDFNAQPLGLAVQGNLFAYTCYDSDDTGVYKAVKVYNFETRKLATITKQENPSRAYSYPSIGEGYVVFSDSLLEGDVLQDNIIYLYDTKSSILNTIDNAQDANLPVTSGKYISACVREKDEQKGDSIVIYDIEQEQWVQKIDETAPIFKGVTYKFSPADLQMSGDYLVWRGAIDRAFYAYNIKENTFYELFGMDEDRYLGYILYSNAGLLAWVDDTANWNDARFRYIILN